MELKEYYKILKSNISVIIYVVLIAVVAVYAWSVRVSQTYSASLLLNISRTEFQPSSDYRYDQFYRLQADEKFAETIIGWLKMPGVTKDIFDRAGINTDEKSMRQLGKSFRAEKLSVDLVGVKYETQTEDEAKKIANAASAVISEKTKSLNAEARDSNWFKVDMSNLVILKNTQDLRVNLAIAVLAGIFIGTLFAFVKHYISEEN